METAGESLSEWFGCEDEEEPRIEKLSKFGMMCIEHMFGFTYLMVLCDIYCC